MANSIELRKIHIRDSAILRTRGLMEGTLALIEDDIRAFGRGSSGEALIALKNDEIYAMVKIFRPDRRMCRAHLEFVFTKDANADTQSAIVDRLLKYCFLEEFYHKVTIICDSGNEGLERIITGAGFVQEAVLRDEVRNKKSFCDSGLFSMLSYEYPAYNVCFVPFERGIAMIGGGKDYIDRVKLFHYGQIIENDKFAENVAGGLGLLEESGALARNDGRYAIDAEQLEYLPEEVGRAALQLTEYFSSSRAGFDINIEFSEGTDFQREVWKALCSIPYGATVSYEDVAMTLTGGDKSKARKITRAVGAACGDNPIAVIVPCHRVIGKDGSIVGYSAGIDIKDYLLLHETFTAVTPLGFKEA